MTSKSSRNSNKNSKLKMPEAASCKHRDNFDNEQAMDSHDDGDAKLKTKELEEEERRCRAVVTGPLLMHAYHLPGNKTWQSDLWQYLTNNHPLFGICFSHKYHPLSWKMRVATLLGSVLFGLALTNIIYLAFVFTDQDHDKEYLTLSTNVTQTGLNQALDDTVSTISVTNGNLVLWTVGAAIHGFYDNVIWSLAACTCCTNPDDPASKQRQQRLARSMGALLVNLSVIVVLAMATFAVFLRAAIDANSGSEEERINVWQSHTQVQEQLQVLPQQEFQNFDFVISYFVELVLTFIVFYPIVGSILFSGIITCGKYPVTGGRPYELAELDRQKYAKEDEEDEEVGVEVPWKDSKQSRNDATQNLDYESSTHTMSDNEEGGKARI